MAYDMGKDHEDFLKGANDFGHARLAKGLMDKKRAAKAAGATAPPPGGDAPPEAPMEGEPSPEMAPEPGGEEMPAEGAPPPDAKGKIPIEVTPEELALLEKLRASKAGGEPDGDEGMSSGIAIGSRSPPRL